MLYRIAVKASTGCCRPRHPEEGLRWRMSAYILKLINRGVPTPPAPVLTVLLAHMVVNFYVFHGDENCLTLKVNCQVH